MTRATVAGSAIRCSASQRLRCYADLAILQPNWMLSELKTLRRLVKVTVEYALLQPVPPRRKKSHISRRSRRRAKRRRAA